MPELNQAALPFYPLTVGILLLLLFAPTFGEKARTTIAMAFLLGAAALGILAGANASTVSQLHVPTVFRRASTDSPHVFTIETVEAPGWRWPAAAALCLVIPSLLLLLRRARLPAVPSIVFYGALLSWWFLVTRLLLEKTAAPVGLVWATGPTVAALCIVVFAGAWAGRRGLGFLGWAGSLFLMALLARAAIVAAGWWATTRHAGTHLDLTVLDDVDILLLGPIAKDTPPTERWVSGIVFPQAGFTVATVLVGLLLGAIPYWLARRKQ